MRVLRIPLLLLLSSCAGPGGLAPLPAGGIHVLFVGNSLTYVNDLPATVASIGALAGDTIRYATDAGADLALIDHLQGATSVVADLKGQRWNFVVLQQGPTPAGICRDSLVLWAKMFAPLVRAAGAEPALFMSWPGAAYRPLFDEVRVSFQAAAVGVSGTFLPAGEAWRAAWAMDSTLELYGSDGYHPSATGTFLAALEIYERLTGRDVRQLPPQAFVGTQALTLPAETVRRLQAAAHQANEAFGSRSAPSAAELAAPSTFVSPTGRC